MSEVVLSDTEDAVKIPEGQAFDDPLGNRYWRSSEANLGRMVDQKTDIFSFGTLVSYRRFAAHGIIPEL